MVLATPPSATTRITLEGIQWATFRSLIAENQENLGYKIFYTPDQLQIEYDNAKSLLAEGTLIFKGISWPTYRSLMSDVGDGRAWRIAYDQGVLEIRMPLVQHEEPKIMLSNFVEVLADELEIEIRELGSLTLEREDLTKAIEPDTCFYIQNELRVRQRERIDLSNDPPPDLAIESDHTHSSLNKQSLYAELGAPELWRYRKRTLEVYQLNHGNYKQVSQSLVFPCLPIDQVPLLIEQSKQISQRTTVRLFRDRIRQILKT
jgi:Uma2 family endonuclease